MQVLFLVPVKQDGKVVMVLRGSMWTEGIAEVVYEQPVPTTWIAAVVDQNMIQIARSQDAARFVGLLRSQGDYQTLRREGLDDEILGADKVEQAAARAWKGGTRPLVFTYRVRLGVVS